MFLLVKTSLIYSVYRRILKITDDSSHIPCVISILPVRLSWIASVLTQENSDSKIVFLNSD